MYTLGNFQDLQNHSYFSQPADPDFALEWTELDSMFSFLQGTESSPLCQDSTLALFVDEALTIPWVDNPSDPRVELQTNSDGT